MTLAPVAVALAAATAVGAAGWRDEPPLPVARGEVAATAFGDGIAVVGGFLADGTSSTRVEVYAPATRRWRRLPDLPGGVNHTFAAAWRGKLYVVGGYGPSERLRTGWALDRGRWRPLPPLPYGLAAGGAAVIGGSLYLVGGVAGPNDRRVLPRRVLVLELAHPRRWRFAPGPAGREHLAVTTSAGSIYAIGGRSAGYDTNSRLVQSWKPSSARWQTRASLPEARGGTGAAAVGGTIVSVGGEAPSGTLASVFAYDVSQDAWRRLPDLPTPRHGLGVAAFRGRVFSIGGGRTPGAAVSTVSESLAVSSS
jgi:non-specific serine/threonine protein kinase